MVDGGDHDGRECDTRVVYKRVCAGRGGCLVAGDCRVWIKEGQVGSKVRGLSRCGQVVRVTLGGEEEEEYGLRSFSV